MIVRIVLLLSCLLFAGQEAIHACGPFLPDACLYGGNEVRVLRMPEANFYHELELIVRGGTDYQPERAGWVDFRDEIEEIKTIAQARSHSVTETMGDAREITLAGDIADLENALKESGLEEEAIRKLLPRYAIVRRDTLFAPYPDMYDLTPHQNTLDSIPREFALYLRGALAHRASDCETAGKYWSEILALPGDQRRYRSVWASFMLGKCSIENRPAEAVRLFEQTRAFAREGFKDSIGLSLVSLGQQARAEIRSKDFIAGIHHYYELSLTEEEQGVFHRSLRVACIRALQSDPINTDLVQDPLCRMLLTSWVISHQEDFAGDHRWVDAVAQAGIKDSIDGADRLAWLAYEAGRMDLANQWLGQAPPDSACAQWVKSKLLLRQGRINEAMAILSSLTESFPPEEEWENQSEYSTTGARESILNDYGILLLGRKDYVSALDMFMKSGYWLDAAYVADRILTTTELEDYVNQLVSDATGAKPEELKGYGAMGGDGVESIKYLLARRLVRNHEYDRALKWLPESTKPLLSEYSSLLRSSGDTKQLAQFRASQLFKAANLICINGMELSGTEVLPDFNWCEGTYELPMSQQLRNVAQEVPAFMKPSADELKRFHISAPKPDKRFHYRYVASDLMWECAKLLPDNDPLLAQALYQGGTLIENRDPKSADKFYKALVRRCPKLPIGQEADRLRWFPKTPPE